MSLQLKFLKTLDSTSRLIGIHGWHFVDIHHLDASYALPSKGQLNEKILLASLKENRLKCRIVRKVSFFHFSFQRYWGIKTPHHDSRPGFWVGWVLATLTSYREPCTRPKRKILAGFVISSSRRIVCR